MSEDYYYKNGKKFLIKARWYCRICGSIDWIKDPNDRIKNNEYSECAKCGSSFCAVNRGMKWFDTKEEVDEYREALESDEEVDFGDDERVWGYDGDSL